MCGMTKKFKSLIQINCVTVGNLPFPNLALMELGASCLARAESVGPSRSLHCEMHDSPIVSNAITGPRVTKFNNALQRKERISYL